MYNKKTFKLAIVVIVLLITYSCSVEYKVAREFVKNRSQVDILLMVDPFVDMYNQTIEIDSTIYYTDYQLDSIAWYNSKIVQFVDKDRFIDAYKNKLISELKRYGVRVIEEDSINSYFNSESKSSWLINVSEFQVMESYFYQPVFKMDATEYDDEYVKLYSLDFSLWFEITKMNSNINEKLNLDGYVEEYLEQDTYYDINYINRIFPDDLYNIADSYGEMHAQYIFDYLLNNYIKRNTKSDTTNNNYYYHYEPSFKLLFKTAD
ncbi:MAG: hypothetical protein WBH98_04410 [Bacteroidales bacterium]